jgi:hypothetical protein
MIYIQNNAAINPAKIMENIELPKKPQPWDHIVVNNIPGTPPSGPPKLRAASNALKHGLYSSEFVFATASDKSLFEVLLHDFREEYQPITATESSLVQELAELKYRYLKVQKLHSSTLREEVLRQAKNAEPTPVGETPTETDIEARAYLKLVESSPGFRLFQREMERLPNRIHKVIARLHINLKLRDELAFWTYKPYPSQPSPEPEPSEAPKPIDIEAKSEDKSKTQETKPKRKPGQENWPSVCADRHEFYKVWDEELDEKHRQIVLTGEPDDYRRRAFFEMCGHDLAQMKAWLAHREFEKENEPKL